MSGRPHEIITTPDTGASWFSKEGSIRKRFDRRLRLLALPDDLTGWNAWISARGTVTSRLNVNGGAPNACWQLTIIHGTGTA